MDRTPTTASSPEDFVKFFKLCSWITSITFSIVASLSHETIKSPTYVDPKILSPNMESQTAFRADSVGLYGQFGFIPHLLGTMFITVLAMCIVGPSLPAIYSRIFKPNTDK